MSRHKKKVDHIPGHIYADGSLRSPCVQERRSAGGGWGGGVTIFSSLVRFNMSSNSRASTIICLQVSQLAVRSSSTRLAKLFHPRAPASELLYHFRSRKPAHFGWNTFQSSLKGAHKVIVCRAWRPSAGPSSEQSSIQERGMCKETSIGSVYQGLHQSFSLLNAKSLG